MVRGKGIGQVSDREFVDWQVKRVYLASFGKSTMTIHSIHITVTVRTVQTVYNTPLALDSPENKFHIVNTSHFPKSDR